MKIMVFFIAMFLPLTFTTTSFGDDVYSYGKGRTVIGSQKTYKIKEGESLIEIARNFDLGYNEIVDANPRHDPFVPKTGVSIKIPTLWILPDEIPHIGIVINLSEMRLYYFLKQKKAGFVKTFPIGIGDEGSDTPIGNFKVIEKIENPSWHVPESIRKEKPQLPRVVPPGPDNPLGSRALRLSLGDVLIHGTDQPWGIGRRVSHGCIRLYPEDIVKLFNVVPNSTKVAIIRQPIKIGIKNNAVYVEVHYDDTMKDLNYFDTAIVLLSRKDLIKDVNLGKLYNAVAQKSGVPVKISADKK